MESPGRAAAYRGVPAGWRAGVLRAGRKRGAGTRVARATGSAAGATLRPARGHLSRPPQPCHPTAAPHPGPVPPRSPARGSATAGSRSRCAVSSPSRRDLLVPALPSRLLSVSSRLPSADLHPPAAHCHGPLRSSSSRTAPQSTRAPPPCPRVRVRARSPPKLASRQSPPGARRSGQSRAPREGGAPPAASASVRRAEWLLRRLSAAHGGLRYAESPTSRLLERPSPCPGLGSPFPRDPSASRLFAGLFPALLPSLVRSANAERTSWFLNTRLCFSTSLHPSLFVTPFLGMRGARWAASQLTVQSLYCE